MVAKYEEGEHSIVESYKSMRTTITVNEKLKTILVTSSEMNEGKTTTTSNLAKCFSELGTKKILLIDCDLRKPSIHKHLEIENEKGLVDVLEDNQDIYECINYEDNLHILTTGKRTQNPAELLDSDKMRSFIKAMECKYDYIFIDSPPVSRVNDACIVAKYVDGTIVVSASNEVDIELVKMTRKRLSKVNANIIGVVLNKFKSVDDSYHSYYDYYDEETKKSKFKWGFKHKKRK